MILASGPNRYLGYLGDAVKHINLLASAIEPLPTFAESVIRCITFNLLDIRHTCCASIGMQWNYKLPADYGSDFDELREEDEDRVQQLNKLVVNFMDQYNASGVSLKDYISGLWLEQMDRFELEENSKEWTTEEKNKLLSIGVLPEEETADPVDESDIEDEDEDEWWQPGYWNRQFEIIANGGRGRSEEEDLFF
ncbi:hypothetical protein E0Z10_g6673 [Xylaria hypoxylon]|uniref:Uncharacterized protein n=1 Tax=Xylaria hypoxylon TaxID=37992 RepID=A0A4Z0YRR3_9PEZI|nr:hypothetical protein E0Z10_g6673 [Xylaria hypoxylon]